MLNKNYDAAETYVNATRPAIIDAVAEVLNFYGIKQKLEVYYNGEAEVARTYGSSYDDPSRSNQATDFINRGKVFVIPDITPTEFNSGYGNSGRDQTNLAMWFNKDARMTVTPDYDGRLVKVDISAHIATRQDAINFRNRLQKRKDRQSGRATFEAHIHYPIPNEVVLLAYELYTLNHQTGVITPEDEENIPLSFINWFKQSGLAPVDIITNRANENPTFVFKRRLRENTIIFEDPTIALTRKNAAYLGKYEVSFAFSFYWQELTHWRVEHPLLIMQRQIGHAWLPKFYKDDKMRRTFNQAIEKSQAAMIRGLWNDDWLDVKRIPVYDPWIPQINSEGLEPKIIAITPLSDVQEQIIVNINKLKINWDPVIYNFMIQYRDRICMRGELIMHWRLYSDDLEVNNEQIELRENGDIVLLRPPTMPNTYRLVLFIDTEVGLLNERGRRTIIEDYNYQTEVFPRVFPWWNWTKINGWIPPEDWEIDPTPPVTDNKGLEEVIINVGKAKDELSSTRYMLDMSLIARSK